MPKTPRIKTPCFVELKTVNDLARLNCAMERIPLPVFAFRIGEIPTLSIQFDFYLGRAILYYARSEHTKQFLGYRNSGGLEEVMSSSSISNPSFQYAPVIQLSKLPKIFTTGLRREIRERFLPMEVKDLPSLANICSYQMVFEKPPLPLFLFPHDGRSVLGTFTRVDENEDVAFFFHSFLEKEPTENFLKYSTTKAEEATFTNKTEEHGTIFIKMVRLKEKHPMVDV